MSKLTVGQVLHEPPSNIRGSWSEHTVISIGKKWATLSGHKKRCSLDTLRLDRGQYTHTQLHVSREEYEKAKALRAAWYNLGRRVDAVNPPDGVTLEIIAQVEAMLGIGRKP